MLLRLLTLCTRNKFENLTKLINRTHLKHHRLYIVSRLKHLTYLLFAVQKPYFYAEFLTDVLRQMLRTIYAAVLTSGATE